MEDSHTVPTAYEPWTAWVGANLLPALQDHGLAMDVRLRLRLELVLAALGPVWDRQGPRAKGMLRAVLCKSQAAQQLFDVAWESLDRPAPLPGAVTPPTLDPEPSLESERVGIPSVEPSWRFGRSALIAAVLCLATIAAGVQWYQMSPSPSQRPNRTPPERTQPGVVPGVREIPLDRRVRSIVSEHREILTVPADVAARLRLAGFCLAGLGAALLGVLLARQQIQRHALERRPQTEALNRDTLFVRTLLPVSGIRRRLLRDAARRWRRPRASGIRQIDVDATIAATARRGGLLTTRYQVPRRRPEYLALIERHCGADQQALLMRELLRDLEREGVTLNVFSFDSDPRWIRPWQDGPRGSSDSSRPLDSVRADRHAGLLVCAQGGGFQDRYRQTLQPWVSTAFRAWPRRVFLTPVPTQDWGPLEYALAGATDPAALADDEDAFLVLPAGTDALRAAVDWFEGRLPTLTEEANDSGRLPPKLKQDPGLWLSNAAPSSPQALAEMLADLQNSLGATAYRWLAAAARYPEFSLAMVRYLAQRMQQQLVPARSVGNAADPPESPLRVEARLMAIAQTPWGRQGWMPDWLREAMFNTLPLPTQVRTNRALVDLLNKVAGRTAAGDQKIPLGDFAIARPWQRWLNRLRLQAWRTQDEIGPLRDAFFLETFTERTAARKPLEVESDFARFLQQRQPRLTRNPWRWAQAGWLLLRHRSAVPKVNGEKSPPETAPKELAPMGYTTGAAPRIFLDYVDADAADATRVKEWLESVGCRVQTPLQVSLDEKPLNALDRMAERAMDHTLILWTRFDPKSYWISGFSAWLDSRRRLTVIVPEDAPPLPDRLSRYPQVALDRDALSNWCKQIPREALIKGFDLPKIPEELGIGNLDPELPRSVTALPDDWQQGVFEGSQTPSVKEDSSWEFFGEPQRPANLYHNVLWVDDQPDNNILERELMEIEGLHFVLARSTAEALTQLRERRFAAVISDVGRPDGNREGYRLLAAMRETDQVTPFFIYTAVQNPKQVAELLALGAQGVTNEPHELVALVLAGIGARQDADSLKRTLPDHPRALDGDEAERYT